MAWHETCRRLRDQHMFETHFGSTLIVKGGWQLGHGPSAMLSRNSTKQSKQKCWHLISFYYILLGSDPAPYFLQARSRFLTLLVATGTGYLGYDQYGRYREQRLAELGMEAPPPLASDKQVCLRLSINEKFLIPLTWEWQNLLYKCNCLHM